MTFQRARSEEQREVRRRAILETAAAMLDEMPVADVSLNELSRRVGLAKSNVLRYFDSREGVLLELMDSVLRDWLAELADDLADRGEEDEVRELVRQLFARGTSAVRQRATWRRTGDLREVAAGIVREGDARD